MSRLPLILAGLAAGALLAGCGTSRGQLPLLQLSPADLGAPRTLEQRLSLTRGGQTRMIEAVVQCAPEKLTMVATTLGVRLYEVSYDGRHALMSEAQLPAASLPPAVVVNDYILLYAPAEPLRRALPPGYTLVADPRTRRLMRGGHAVMRIDYDSEDPAAGRSRLHDAALGVDLVIDSVIVP
jgi:hypothetical protein